MDKIQLQEAISYFTDDKIKLSEEHRIKHLNTLLQSAQAVLSGEVLSVSEIEKILHDWDYGKGCLMDYDLKNLATAIHNAMGGER
jgi:hypothetical protein